MPKTLKEVCQTEPVSVINAEILRAVCPECNASKDNWKTFHNWQRQGMRVRKGQHGTKIADLQKYEADNQDDETTGNEFWRLVPLFCKHQVSKITGKSANGQKTEKVERD